MGSAHKINVRKRMSKDARLVDSITRKTSKLALTGNQHRSSRKGETGVISPTSHQVSNEPKTAGSDPGLAGCLGNILAK